MSININELQYIKVECIHKDCIATLVDTTGYEVLKGYGKNITEAINDLHRTLL